MLALAKRIFRLRNSVAAWGGRQFFLPASPTALAICRLWFYADLLYLLWHADLAALANLPADFWRPTPLFTWLPGPITSPDLLYGLQTLFIAATAGCLLGLHMRVCGWAALLLAIPMFGLPQCYGVVHHKQILTVLALGIFALAKPADVLSLDSLRRGRPQVLPQDEYRWPIGLMQMLMCVVFFAAGVAKIRYGGPAWVLSDNLKNTLLLTFYDGTDPPTRLALWLVQYPLLCKLLAAGTIWIELSAPLALVSRRYRWFVVPSLLSMQVGIYFVMGIDFHAFMACYVFWVPWGEIAERVVTRRQDNRETSASTAEPALRQAA